VSDAESETLELLTQNEAARHEVNRSRRSRRTKMTASA
jgi:hypothetical protein